MLDNLNLIKTQTNGLIGTFRTGSSLVKGAVPNDIDIVCLFENEKLLDNYFVGISRTNNSENGINYPAKFKTYRHEVVNFIATSDKELFYRFKAFSGALVYLSQTDEKYKDKEERIKLAISCLYWEEH